MGMGDGDGLGGGRGRTGPVLLMGGHMGVGGSGGTRGAGNHLGFGDGIGLRRGVLPGRYGTQHMVRVAILYYNNLFKTQLASIYHGGTESTHSGPPPHQSPPW